ncbi:MAG: hypothetical protein WA709_00705 [Stellaceae bacterium]
MIGNAVKVMRIATGEELEEIETDDGKDKTAHRLDTPILAVAIYSSNGYRALR